MEDCVNLTNFIPPPPRSKKGSNRNNDEDNIGVDDADENLNLVVDDRYNGATKLAMSKMSEKEISFELIDVSHQFNTMLVWSTVCCIVFYQF